MEHQQLPTQQSWSRLRTMGFDVVERHEGLRHAHSFNSAPPVSLQKAQDATPRAPSRQEVSSHASEVLAMPPIALNVELEKNVPAIGSRRKKSAHEVTEPVPFQRTTLPAGHPSLIVSTLPPALQRPATPSVIDEPAAHRHDKWIPSQPDTDNEEFGLFPKHGKLSDGDNFDWFAGAESHSSVGRSVSERAADTSRGQPMNLEQRSGTHNSQKETSHSSLMTSVPSESGVRADATYPPFSMHSAENSVVETDDFLTPPANPCHRNDVGLQVELPSTEVTPKKTSVDIGVASPIDRVAGQKRADILRKNLHEASQRIALLNRTLSELLEAQQLLLGQTDLLREQLRAADVERCDAQHQLEILRNELDGSMKCLTDSCFQKEQQLARLQQDNKALQAKLGRSAAL